MNRFLKIGQVFSRDCFLCFGGAMLLTAFGSMAINVPDILKHDDWPPLEIKQFFSTAAFLTIHGAAYLVAAYALFRKRRWGPYFAAVASGLEIALMTVTWSGETVKLRGFAIILSFYVVPMLLTFVWALAESARQLKEQSTTRATEGRGHQIA
ncbi:MAG: hypothetical protein WBP79_04800 [Candidatus Acidiferrales bacterium]